MRRAQVVLENDVFHAGDRLLLSGLTREHQQRDPLELLRIQLISIEREHPLNHDLALMRAQDMEALEREQEAATFGREA